MPKKPEAIFRPEQFVAWAETYRSGLGTPEHKAWFANYFVRFVESDFALDLFTERFYTVLHTYPFQRIAQTNRHGFYNTWFGRLDDQIAFLEHTVHPPSGFAGSPAHTYVDVERALAAWVQATGQRERVRARRDEAQREREQAQLRVLLTKYGLPPEFQHPAKGEE